MFSSISLEKDNYFYLPQFYAFSHKFKNIAASVQIIFGLIIFVPIL